MKRAVDMNMYNEIFYEFLPYDSEEFPVDVNAVENCRGTPETLLDYLDDIIYSPELHQHYWMPIIVELRDIIVDEYGAKHARDLASQTAD